MQFYRAQHARIQKVLSMWGIQLFFLDEGREDPNTTKSGSSPGPLAKRWIRIWHRNGVMRNHIRTMPFILLKLHGRYSNGKFLSLHLILVAGFVLRQNNDSRPFQSNTPSCNIQLESLIFLILIIYVPKNKVVMKGKGCEIFAVFFLASFTSIITGSLDLP